MTSPENLPPAHHTEPSYYFDASDLQSSCQLIGLAIPPEVPANEDRLHGSRFIECMDYSITSFGAQMDDTKRCSQVMNPIEGLVPSSMPPSPPSRRSSRGLGSLVRMLSLRNTSKRDISPNSVTTKLLQFKPESSNCQSINSAKLARRMSHKSRRTSSGLLIESGKLPTWSSGLKNKTFTPSFLLNASTTPTSLSSSASGFSADTSVVSNSKAKTYLLSGTVLRTPRFKRSNSMTAIHAPQSYMPTSIIASKHDLTPTFEPPSRSSFSLKSIGLQRRDKIGKNYIPSSPLILSKLPSSKKKTSDKFT